MNDKDAPVVRQAPHSPHRGSEIRGAAICRTAIRALGLIRSAWTGEESARRLEELERLSHAIERLPPRRREILILYKLHGWSHKRIAARFGISKSAVQKHVFAALAVCLQATDDPPP